MQAHVLETPQKMLKRVLTAVAILTAVATLVACDSIESPSVTGDNDGRKRLNASVGYAEFGGYVVHVSAMNSDSLTAEIASAYDITRSEDVGLINLVVLQKSDDPGTDMPVTADVQLSAANLTGQVKNMQLQEIQDGISIYYIGSVGVENRETINFDFDIRPTDTDRTLKVRFTHEFYTR